MAATNNPLVVRTSVRAKGKYGEYRQELRYDFFYACAYCYTSENDAHGISFEIDHYRPVSARPDLENDYSNLMYSCDECNGLKRDHDPPEAASAAGVRFFRCDIDVFDEHYQTNGILLEHKSKTGNYTIDQLRLNRKALRDVREHRKEMSELDAHIAIGMQGLRNLSLDQFPPTLRLKAKEALDKIVKLGEEIKDEVETAIRQCNRSSLLDPEQVDCSEDVARRERLADFRKQYPGSWLGRNKSC